MKLTKTEKQIIAAEAAKYIDSVLKLHGRTLSLHSREEFTLYMDLFLAGVGFMRSQLEGN